MIKESLPTIASMYAKRILEKHYDKLSATEVFSKLKSMDNSGKYIIEFMLYVLSSFLDQNIDENTAIKKFLREIGIDAPPEIAKRIMNHNNLTGHPNSNKSSLLGIFLGLEIEDDDLMKITDWLHKLESAQREKVLTSLGSLTKEDIERISKMDSEKIERILLFTEEGVFEKKSFMKKTSESTGEILDELNTWLKSKL